MEPPGNNCHFNRDEQRYAIKLPQCSNSHINRDKQRNVIKLHPCNNSHIDQRTVAHLYVNMTVVT
jgi:hypothetical protein